MGLTEDKYDVGSSDASQRQRCAAAAALAAVSESQQDFLRDLFDARMSTCDGRRTHAHSTRDAMLNVRARWSAVRTTLRSPSVQNSMRVRLSVTFSFGSWRGSLTVTRRTTYVSYKAARKISKLGHTTRPLSATSTTTSATTRDRSEAKERRSQKTASLSFDYCHPCIHFDRLLLLLSDQERTNEGTNRLLYKPSDSYPCCR